MCEWEAWAPGDPRRDTNTGRAARVSFKHTMHVIQTSGRAHKDSVHPRPPSTTTERVRQRTWLWNVLPLRVQLPVEHPPLPDSPRHPPDGAGARVCVCAPSPPWGSKCLKQIACVRRFGPQDSSSDFFFFSFKKGTY